MYSCCDDTVHFQRRKCSISPVACVQPEHYIQLIGSTVTIPHSGNHQSAGRKTSIRGEKNTNPRKERSNSHMERTLNVTLEKS